MSTDEMLMLGLETWDSITKMFEADRKKQGQYVPPMLVHTVGEGNKVTKTIEITDDGVTKDCRRKDRPSPKRSTGMEPAERRQNVAGWNVKEAW